MSNAGTEYGLETLHSTDQADVDGIVDVVTVHGLYGDPKRTWFPTPDVLDVRLHTWFNETWYSKVRFSVYSYSSGDLQNHGFARHGFRVEAMRLLDAVDALTSAEEPAATRKLVFFAHDIRGTIVQEAMNIAAFGHARHSATYFLMPTFVYFGCPLRYETVLLLRDSFLRLLRVNKSPAASASFELAASLARAVAEIIDDALDSSIQYTSPCVIFSSSDEDESKRVFNPYETTRWDPAEGMAGLGAAQLQFRLSHADLALNTELDETAGGRWGEGACSAARLLMAFS